MNEREYPFVRDYHARLVTHSDLERRLHLARPLRFSIWDRLLLAAGNLLVAAGERLRSGRAVTMPQAVQREFR